MSGSSLVIQTGCEDFSLLSKGAWISRIASSLISRHREFAVNRVGKPVFCPTGNEAINSDALPLRSDLSATLISAPTLHGAAIRDANSIEDSQERPREGVSPKVITRR